MQSIIIRRGDFIIIKIYRPITITLIMCIPGGAFRALNSILNWEGGKDIILLVHRISQLEVCIMAPRF